MYPIDENDNLTIDEELDVFDEIDEVDEIEDVVDEPEEDDVADVLIGTVSGCQKLNVRFKPNPKSDIVCEIDNNTEVMIDESGSTNEFYKVYIAS